MDIVSMYPCTHIMPKECLECHYYLYIIFKASQPRGRASGSRAYGRHEMQGVTCTYT